MPRWQLLHGWVERCRRLRSWYLLRVCIQRLLELRSGHLSVARRLQVVCELRRWLSVSVDRPRLSCSLPRWELLLGRYRPRGCLSDRNVFVVTVEQLLKLRCRHLSSLCRVLGLLSLSCRKLLRHYRAFDGEWHLRARELLCCLGEQLHTLLEQHVLGRVGLDRVCDLQWRSVLGRWLDVVHRFMPSRPVRCVGRLLWMRCRDVVECSDCDFAIYLLKLRRWLILG
jgi:hypothetical protein